MVRWNVYSRGKLIDGVFYNKNCDAAYVKDSLINHDGYPNDIIVKRVRGEHPKQIQGEK